MKDNSLCLGFSLSRVFGGFFAGRLYRTLKGHRWKKGAFCVSLVVFSAIYPGLLMARYVDKLHACLRVAGHSLAVLQRFGVDQVLVALRERASSRACTI